MPLVDRCDEITRLIEDALRSSLPAAELADADATERDEGSCTVHATDGRWWQRPPAPKPAVRTVAA